MASKGKSPGLTGFFEQKDAAASAAASLTKKRRKGTGKYRHITLRLKDENWLRVHQLAMAEDAYITDVIILGINKIFEEKGLPPLAPQ
jgi:hypothetical protein